MQVLQDGGYNFGHRTHPPQIDHGESEYRNGMSKFHVWSVLQHLAARGPCEMHKVKWSTPPPVPPSAYFGKPQVWEVGGSVGVLCSSWGHQEARGMPGRPTHVTTWVMTWVTQVRPEFDKGECTAVGGLGWLAPTATGAPGDGRRDAWRAGRKSRGLGEVGGRLVRNNASGLSR